MIQKLRIRFILLSMSTLLAVLVVLVGGINIANYTGFVSEADRILTSENPGRMGKNKNPGWKEQNGIFDPFSMDVHNYTRFFSITLLPDGTVLDAQLPITAVIGKEEAAALATKVFAKPFCSICQVLFLRLFKNWTPHFCEVQLFLTK